MEPRNFTKKKKVYIAVEHRISKTRRFDAIRHARLSMWQETAQTADLLLLFRGHGATSYDHKAEEAVEYIYVLSSALELPFRGGLIV